MSDMRRDWGEEWRRVVVAENPHLHSRNTPPCQVHETGPGCRVSGELTMQGMSRLVMLEAGFNGSCGSP